MTGPGDERGGGERSGRRDGGTGSGDQPRRHGAVAVVFACATPLAVLLLPPMPMLIATPILAIGALVSGIGARRAARQTGGTAPGTGTAIAIGAVGLVTALVVGPLFGPPLTRYENCLGGANTVQDEKTCERKLEQSLQSRLPFASPDLLSQLTG